MNGKEKCRILKQIRQQIAQENDISLVVEECTHKGECRGTCPRCESEVRYLEAELEKRRSLKKKIALAGISAGVVASLSGCAVVDTIQDIINPPLTGMVPAPTEEVLEGSIELMGDVPFEAALDETPEEADLPIPMGTAAPVCTPNAEFDP